VTHCPGCRCPDRAASPPREVRLVARVDQYDLVRGGRLFVEGRGHFHFRGPDWQGDRRGPQPGQSVTFRPTPSGGAREVRA
jgi:hypothetical protein